MENANKTLVHLPTFPGGAWCFLDETSKLYSKFCFSSNITEIFLYRLKSLIQLLPIGELLVDRAVQGAKKDFGGDLHVIRDAFVADAGLDHGQEGELAQSSAAQPSALLGDRDELFGLAEGGF